MIARLALSRALSLERYICESGVDLCPNDPQKVDFGECGCASPDADTDGDGALDCQEQCPNDPARLVPGDCGCANAPKPAGTVCRDGLCGETTVCNGAGVCGNPAGCPAPDSLCRYGFARNSHYWFCDNDRPFDEAHQRCRTAGMDLVTLDDAREDGFLLLNLIEHSFLGASDQGVEGDWTWFDSETPFWTGGLLGSPAAGSYTNWKFGDPNDGLFGRDCLVKAPLLAGGLWQARSCSEPTAFACEREFKGTVLPDLALVAEVELAGARGHLVEPPLALDAVTPNPNGLRKVIVRFNEPIDPASFRIDENAIAVLANELGQVPTAPALSGFYTSAAFLNENRTLELSIAPARVKTGSTYELGINTNGLVLKRGITIGRSAQPEVKFAAGTVLRPDGMPPSITLLDPPVGALRVEPHANILARFSEPMSFVNFEVTPSNTDRAAQSGLVLRERLEVDSDGGHRSFLSSRTPSGLLLDTAYTVLFNGASTPGFGRLPGSQDLSGEVLDSSSTIAWTFRTSGVRIESPRYNDRVPQAAIGTSGLASISTPGPVTVEVRTMTGQLVSGPVTAARTTAIVSTGGAPANPWSAQLPNPAQAGPFKVIATAGQHKDTVVFSRVPDIIQEASFRADAIVEHRGPENPLVRLVTRDNPGITGSVDLQAGERGSASPPWSANGRWTGLDGQLWYDRELFRVEFSGVKHIGVFVTDASYDFLPAPGDVSGPAPHSFLTRGGRLAPGGIRFVKGWHQHFTPAGTLQHDPDVPLPILLSEDTLVVPVLLIFWHHQVMGIAREDADRGKRETEAMFDFILPLGGTQPNPTGPEVPPDEIWAQCNIQFQVVGAFVFELPPESPIRTPGAPRCVRNQANDREFLSLDNTENLLRPALGPAMAELVLDHLDPIQIHHGNLLGCPFTGKGGTNAADINWLARDPSLTSHELGHVLGHSHNSVAGNLMNASLGTGTNLTPEQCNTSRTIAARHSERFRRFLVKQNVLPPLDRDLPPRPNHGTCAAPCGSTLPRRVCCRFEDGTRLVPVPYCLPEFGGTDAPPIDCVEDPVICCVTSVSPPDAKKQRRSQCEALSATNPALGVALASNQCDDLCCNNETPAISRYRCVQTGGDPRSCLPQ